MRQPYGENGGPGGLSHTLRQVPALLAIAHDMERLCPDAWLINFTNPLPRLCLAVSLYSRIRMVGLCHQLKIAYFLAGAALSEPLGLEAPPGVNSNADPNVWPIARLCASLGGPWTRSGHEWLAAASPSRPPYVNFGVRRQGAAKMGALTEVGAWASGRGMPRPYGPGRATNGLRLPNRQPCVLGT